MKKNLLFLMLFASLISFPAMSQHNFGDSKVINTGKSVTAPIVDSINVDGNLNDPGWRINQAVSKVISGTPGIDSNIVYFGVAYNSEYLYVGIDVTDALLTTYEMGEVFIDGNNNGGQYDNGDLHLRFAGPFIEVVYPDTIIGILMQFAIKPTYNGFTAELGIPWSQLGVTPVAGAQIGFDIIMGDGDSGTGIDYLMSWNGDLSDYAETSNFGKLIFQPEKNVTAPKVVSIVVDGVLDEADWKIDQAVSRIISGTPGIDSNIVYFGVAYNSDYLYVGIDVIDALLTPYELGEVFIDGNNNGGLYDNGDLHLRFAGPYIEVVYPDTILGILMQFNLKPTYDGFTAELGIPWSQLGITPTIGEHIGFDIIMGDGDSGTGVDYLMSWNGDLMDYVETTFFGHLIFGEYTNVGGVNDYSNKIDIFPNPSTGNTYLKIASDSFKGISTINISDIAGCEVFHGQYNCDTENIIRLEAGMLAPGVYIVNIVDQDGVKAIKKLIIR